MMLNFVEAIEDEIYLLGYFRKNPTLFGRQKGIGVAEKFFVARLTDDEICDIRYISESDHRFCEDYKRVEMSGFTEDSVRLSGVSEEKLIAAKNSGFSIARMWKNT